MYSATRDLRVPYIYRRYGWWRRRSHLASRQAIAANPDAVQATPLALRLLLPEEAP